MVWVDRMSPRARGIVLRGTMKCISEQGRFGKHQVGWPDAAPATSLDHTDLYPREVEVTFSTASDQIEAQDMTHALYSNLEVLKRRGHTYICRVMKGSAGEGRHVMLRDLVDKWIGR